MCMGGAPSMPAPTPPPVPEAALKSPSASLKDARASARKTANNKAGIAGTLLTGPGGVMKPATTEKKVLLGA